MCPAAYVHGTQKGLSPSHEYVGGGGGYGLRAEKVSSPLLSLRTYLGMAREKDGDREIGR